MMKTRQAIAFLLLFSTCLAVRAEKVELVTPSSRVVIDPATLAVKAAFADGRELVLSTAALAGETVAELRRGGGEASWSLPARGLRVHCRLEEKEFTIDFRADRPGEICWPVLPAHGPARAYIIPHNEGLYVPVDYAPLKDFLVGGSPMDTTSGLSMPFIGLELGDATLTYIITNQLGNELVFRSTAAGLGVKLTHTFSPLEEEKVCGIRVIKGGASPVEPARLYRKHLAARGEFVSLREKIKKTPRAARLLGAPHAYLWDEGLLAGKDVKDWRGLARKLVEGGASAGETPAKHIWAGLGKEERKCTAQIVSEKWIYAYLTGTVARGLSRVLEDTSLPQRPAWRALAARQERRRGESAVRYNCRLLAAAFPAHFSDPQDWGGGISLGMLRQLRQAGLERINLCLGDLSTARHKGHVASYADELGYLFGPYDCYHSVHKPGSHPDATWETAQFDRELYEQGGIVRADGSFSPGFQRKGYHLSPLAARPYVSERVNRMMAQVPYSCWFVDCDAYGELFEDYSPQHTATLRDDMLARLERLGWLSAKYGLVVGSEGGSAYSAASIHFAHGMLSGAFSWADKDMNDRKSKYYLGAYWPPDGPKCFTAQVPLKQKHRDIHYDPRYRLPLYQVVFHDSVIATHHWGNGSLKYTNTLRTVALLEQLYNVPPLYHLNPEEFKKHRAAILRHYLFFSPLHRRLGLEAMVDFRWLDRERLVQRTSFASGTTITANFGERTFNGEGVNVPSFSALAHAADGKLIAEFRAE